MSLYIAAYDISGNGRRTRVARVLKRYGTRIQLSVFELYLEPDDLVEMRREIGPLLAHDDEFVIVPIDDRPNRQRMRWQRPPDGWEPVTFLDE